MRRTISPAPREAGTQLFVLRARISAAEKVTSNIEMCEKNTRPFGLGPVSPEPALPRMETEPQVRARYTSSANILGNNTIATDLEIASR